MSKRTLAPESVNRRRQRCKQTPFVVATRENERSSRVSIFMTLWECTKGRPDRSDTWGDDWQERVKLGELLSGFSEAQTPSA